MSTDEEGIVDSLAKKHTDAICNNVAFLRGNEEASAVIKNGSELVADTVDPCALKRIVNKRR